MPESQYIAKYVDDVREQFSSGHAREHAYRPALKNLMMGISNITAVNDPKRSEHGNPDMAFLKRPENNFFWV